MSPRTAAPPAPDLGVTEAEFMAAVIELAMWTGWRVYHTRDSRGSYPGFPDLCLVRRGRLIFAELKKEGGKLTAHQKRWLQDLAQTHADVFHWQPSEWDEIVRELTRNRERIIHGGAQP